MKNILSFWYITFIVTICPGADSQEPPLAYPNCGLYALAAIGGALGNPLSWFGCTNGKVVVNKNTHGNCIKGQKFSCTRTHHTDGCETTTPCKKTSGGGCVWDDSDTTGDWYSCIAKD